MTPDITKTIGLILGLSIGAQWLGWLWRLPAVVLLLFFGIVAGPILGWINPEQALGTLFHPTIELVVAIILFEGGLNLHLREFKEIAAGIGRLVSLGAIFNWLLGTLAAHFIGQMSWEVSFLIGAIFVITGPTVIIPILRQRRIVRRLATYLKWEGIIIDPLGVLLAIVVFEYIIYGGPHTAGLAALIKVATALGSALVLSIATGYLISIIFQRGYIAAFLKLPFTLSVVLMIYVIANSIQEGTGLLATTFLGIYVGNIPHPVIEELRRFKESITIFGLSIIFILLSADLDLGFLYQIDLSNFLFLLSILFLVRPVALFLATIKSKMAFKERLLIGWFAPRGIVAGSMAGILGPKLVDHGYMGAELILPLVLSVILLTVLIHSFSLQWVARYLGLAIEKCNGVLIVGASSWSINLALLLKDIDIPVILSDNSWHKLKPARQQGVSTHFGEILTDLEEGNPDLSELGYLLAATENDAYNALISTRLASIFERRNVYQLPLHGMDPSQPEELPPALRGNEINDDRAFFETLIEKYYLGWKFKRTKLSEQYAYSNLLEDEPDAVHFMVMGSSGDISFIASGKKKEPGAGDSIISLSKAKKPVS